MAVSFLDLLWPLFLLLNLEHVRIMPGITVVTPRDLYDYPISHSLVGAIIWSILLGGIYFSLMRDTRTATVVGLAVFSHWVLDFITHRPDMPISFGNTTYVGLGLWGLILFFLVMYLANLFGPPPPSVTFIAIVANAGWLLVIWAWWIDRHRRLKN